MVDAWSSLEMKRYLYMTKKRYRYVYAPELAEAAVYFKSGSFYKCRPEEGFTCAKYSGNVENLMNSVAIIESPAARGPDQKRYIVALLSNVLQRELGLGPLADRGGHRADRAHPPARRHQGRGHRRADPRRGHGRLTTHRRRGRAIAVSGLSGVWSSTTQ